MKPGSAGQFIGITVRIFVDLEVFTKDHFVVILFVDQESFRKVSTSQRRIFKIGGGLRVAHLCAVKASIGKIGKAEIGANG
ncbi:MAG TPA: hypothetical protein VKJ65_11540, partial [Phycisphaerae bacterium]|nr:hypothetical protein [Phycisphaerae bacterium]